MTVKLEIDLVPKSSWFNNLRKVLTKGSWDKIRNDCFDKAGHVCEICGGTGVFGKGKIKVECHEIWEYKENKQILKGVISLCTVCHRVKHYGLSSLRGYENMCIKQLSNINNWNYTQVKNHVNYSFDLWEKRSKQNWELDLSWLKGKDIKFSKKYKNLFSDIN